MENLPHDPVLYHEVIHALQPSPGGYYLDGTVGAGGHARGILEKSAPDGQLLGLDVDPRALEIAAKTLGSFRGRVTLIQDSYTNLEKQVRDMGWSSVDGIILDFGTSSMQLDTAERGFSFLKDAPLDMRFDPRNPTSAAELVNELPEDDLADLIHNYGEERWSRRIAHDIVLARPIHTTGELTDVILKAAGNRYAKSRIHPATRTFQALRIAVNDELNSIALVLPQAIRILKEKGRLAVVSFHSLEDRVVKQYFRQECKDCICPKEQIVCTCRHTSTIMEVNRHPITPGEEEIARNARSRSAKLRIVEKRSGT